MAGIDNNTLLYLRGDSFEDLSLNPKSIINSGFTIEESDMFSKCFYTNNITDKHTNKLSISELNLDLNSDFSIDFMVKPKGANSGGFAILSSNANASIWANNNNAWLLLLKNNKISLTNTVTNTNDIISSNTVLEIDKFYHVELSRCGNMIHIFINGKLEVSVNVGSYVFSYYDFAFGVSDVRGWGANCVINNIRISQLKGHTEDFTPSNQPYNSIDINVTNKTYNQIDFNVTKLGQETINKVEVLQDNEVKATHTEGYDNLIYNFEGSNDVTIRVTYDDNYTEEKTIKVGNSKAKIYLYKEGNECVSLTGGIVGKYNTGGTYTLGTFTKQDKYISCVNNSTTKQVYVTSANKIDLTNYCNFICDFDVVNVRNTSSDAYKPTLTVRSNFAGSSDLLIRGELIANLRQTLTLDITNINYSSNACLQTHANDYNIYKMYFETKENILTINSQEDNNITFSANDLGLVTITKIDVLINGVVSKTYTDEYSNLSYTVDKSLCYIGNNNIEIRVTYSQGDEITETSSEYLTYKNIVPQLPFETPLLDTIERVKLLTKSKQNEKNLLSSILTSKSVEVSEEDKMSDLIGKVDLLDIIAEKLYLYKDGDECVDVTGGIEILFKWEVANYGNNSFGNKYSNYIRLEANGVNSQESGIGAYTVNKIDLTEYSRLCFEYLSENFTHSYGVMFSASSDKPTSCYKGDNKVAYVFETKNPTNKITTLTIDISRITGSYYISGVARASGATTCNADLNIYKIWLEK